MQNLEEQIKKDSSLKVRLIEIKKQKSRMDRKKWFRSKKNR